MRFPGSASSQTECRPPEPHERSEHHGVVDLTIGLATREWSVGLDPDDPSAANAIVGVRALEGSRGVPVPQQVLGAAPALRMQMTGDPLLNLGPGSGDERERADVLR
jgi:hypothetical protein